MSPRYLLVVGDDSGARAELVARLSSSTGLAPSYSSRRMALLLDPSCPCLAVGSSGCVVGSLFHRRGSASALSCLSGQEAASIVASEGQALLTNFWGGYVAAIEGSESVRILREPSGDFPCYFARADPFIVFAADAELLVRGALASVSVDCGEIGKQLFRTFVPVPSTALRGIHELLPGFAMRVRPGGGNQEKWWSPWDHVHWRDDDAEAAAERLSRIIQHSVHAVASRHGRLLLSLSGGLDSSIVAACLAKAGAETICLTMFTEDPAGDERAFAQALCGKLGLRLIEHPYRLNDIDLGKAMAPNLPRPRDRLQALAFERVHHAVASDVGAEAIITGNGGDHIFGYSQSAAPVADRYLTEGLSRNTFSSLIDVCNQTGCSIGDAVRRAWRLAHSSCAYLVRPNPLFLHRDFVASLGANDCHHPWLDAPPGSLPGKAAHVGAILRVQPNLEPSLGDQYAVLNPLVSQPVVEACLAVPTWEWRAGGRDRSLVRRAFARELPPAVLNRRVKGTPGRFAARLLDHFRRPIRERLLDGRLAAEKVVDQAALGRILTGERPVPDLDRVRILELVNAEAWIGHWTTRAKTSEPAKPDLRRGVHVRPPSSGAPTR